MANTSSIRRPARLPPHHHHVAPHPNARSVRTVEEAIKRGDRDAALKAMASAEPELMKAAQRYNSQEPCQPEGFAPDASDAKLAK
jgi:small subunit ribosomal protein S20